MRHCFLCNNGFSLLAKLWQGYINRQTTRTQCFYIIFEEVEYCPDIWSQNLEHKPIPSFTSTKCNEFIGICVMIIKSNYIHVLAEKRLWQHYWSHCSKNIQGPWFSLRIFGCKMKGFIVLRWLLWYLTVSVLTVIPNVIKSVYTMMKHHGLMVFGVWSESKIYVKSHQVWDI